MGDGKMGEKFKVSLLVLLVALLVPNLAFAEGTLLGSDFFEMRTNPNYYLSDTYKDLDGGTFTIKVSTSASTTYTIKIWEYDPTDPDDFIQSYTFTGSKTITLANINLFHDGGNGAEIYAQIGWANQGGATTAYFYD